LSDGQRTRAILLLEERLDRGLYEGGRGVRMRVLGMPWRKENWALTDAIAPEDDARRALLPAAIAHLRRQPDRPAILALGRSRESSALWDGLATMAALKWYAFVDVNEFVVSTDMSPAEFEARLSRNSRQMLRRAARRYDAYGGTSSVRAVAPEDLTNEFERFLDVEASGWKGAHGSAIRQAPGEEGFYRDLVRLISLDGRCEIHSLYAEGRCIASGLWVFTRHQAVLLKCGYDESYAHASPGRLLTHRSLLSCCEDPDTASVSLLGDAPWLRHWGPASSGLLRAYVALRPFSGAAYLAALRLRYGPVRRMMRALRERHGNGGTTARTPGRESE
jgi:CelD/BcsL family acetyltransferase involved in cellulose biosynthesis